MEALFKWPLWRLLLPIETGRSFAFALILIPGTYAASLAQVESESATMLPLSISILYFDQSSHQLRPRVKVTLDSIARLLMEQSKLIASVTGYADNVGKRELNITLAKYRAKTVETYLKQRGVPENQILVNWERPDTNASADERETMKTIRRRVALLLYPR